MNDYFNAIKNGNAKMPKLHGHIKVTTSYAKSGNIAEVVEADNIVTNAMADILSLDYLNGISANSILPLATKWFSGILMYENAFATSGEPAVINPANYYPPNDTNNHLFAHAGPNSPSDTADDTRRGSPNTAAQQYTDGMVKFAWEWGSAQGNSGDRYIRSVALCHGDTGDCGLGSGSNAFQAFIPFANISSLSNLTFTRGSYEETHAFYDDNHGLSFYIGEDGTYQSNTANKETTKVTVNIKRQAFFKTGLVDVIQGSSPIMRKFTVDTPITFYMQPAYWFDRTNKQLWLFTNITGPNGYKSYGFSRTDVKYCIIDCVNEELVNLGTEQEPVYYKTIVSDASDLAPICAKYTGDNDDRYPEYLQIVCNGTEVYFPTTNYTTWTEQVRVTGYKKINLVNNNQAAYTFANSEYLTYLRSAMNVGDLVVGDGFVINGSDIFKCTKSLPAFSYDTLAYTFCSVDKPSNLVMPIATINSASRQRPILASKLLHTTMLNLPSAVQKTTAKNMNVEYTLTEVSS